MERTMRTIKFRGRHLCGQWYYGNLIVRETDSPVPETPLAYKCVYIGDIEDGSEEQVEEETIGQFTGLLDKNGKEIYEGDVIRMSIATYGDEIFRIGYEDSYIGAFCLCSADEEDTSRFVGIFGRNFGYEPFYCEVIGNIHDNPEILKGGKNDN